jgi:hypothetical protein
MGLFLGLALFLSAATPAAAQMTFGVKGGVNIANLSFDPSEGDLESRTGLVVGALVTQPLRSRFGLQIEGLYVQKGAKDEVNEDGLVFKTEIKLDYVEIPVLANVALASSDNLKFSVLAGPTFSFLVSDKIREEFDGEVFEDELGDDIKSYDIGFALAGAVQTGHLVFDVRYTWGLTNLNNEADETQKVKNKSLAFTAGWLFGR